MISKFIRELEENGWKKIAIAKKAGLPNSIIYKAANGAICSAETVIKLADAFEVTTDEVLGRDKPRIRSPIIEKIEEIAGNDEDVARAALKCAQDEKLLKEVRGKGGREKAA